MPLTTDDDHSSRKRGRTGEKSDHSERKRKKGLKYKDEYDDHKHKKHKRKHDKKSHLNITDEADEEDVWIEKNIDGETPLAQDIPTAESLKLTSRAYIIDEDPPPPPDRPSETRLKRDDWMLGDTSITIPTSNEAPKTARWRDSPSQSTEKDGGADFFSALGLEHKRKEAPERPNPDKLVVSSREINPQFREGKTLDEYVTPKSRPATPGGPGSQWRMMKLRRVYETAEEENRPVEEVALDKFGSMEAFEAAKEERRVLDEREGRRSSRGQEDDRHRGDRSRNREGNQGFEQRYMFSEVGSSALLGHSSSFRRPGGQDHSGPSTPVSRGSAPPTNRRLDSLRLPSEASSPATANSVLTPIPTVMTPPASVPSNKFSALSSEDLNKLQARVLKAKLMGSADADRLEREYEAEVTKARSGGLSVNEKIRVEILPTMDARGQLYDVGQGKEDVQILPGNRKKKEKVEMHDPKTGEFVRYNADDDSTTLGDMLRQEKFGAGMADQKNLDAQLAKAIMSDGKFQSDLEYMDENAEKLGRKKMRSDAMKRQFAINDYARTKRVLDSCPHCYGEDDSPPKVPVIAMATRCYLSCTPHEELVDGHCHIVPIQHHLSTLEGDDDLWDEIRNFMKCLMRMYVEQDKGVIFFETVINLKWQKHTYIECVPIPWNVYEDLPAYFKESILQSETEWSQHKKLIDFSARPGGFRRAMVPNLPYFMVQWDYKGEKGYGHVIEGTGEAAGTGEADGAIDEGEKGGGEFPRYFATEIIGNQLDIEPRRWRRPRRIDFRSNKERVSAFQDKYSKYDWTGMIPRS
ncbi:CwfJ C-terminus 1-domain-containing protein-like protein [Hysterangium stoloniferum]|nr:CwfJ C-terminus 1-domain-containing protein-like protein [Hysterangium stoloniferum]